MSPGDPKLETEYRRPVTGPSQLERRAVATVLTGPTASVLANQRTWNVPLMWVFWVGGPTAMPHPGLHEPAQMVESRSWP